MKLSVRILSLLVVGIMLVLPAVCTNWSGNHQRKSHRPRWNAGAKHGDIHRSHEQPECESAHYRPAF